MATQGEEAISRKSWLHGVVIVGVESVVGVTLLMRLMTGVFVAGVCVASVFVVVADGATA